MTTDLIAEKRLPNYVLADYGDEQCIVCFNVLRGDVVRVGPGFRHPSGDPECVPTRRSHDVTDRRRTNMQGAIDVLAGCVADLHMFADKPGVVTAVADRIARLAIELETFRARDLINMRDAAKAVDL